MVSKRGNVYNFQNCSRFLKTIEYFNTVRLIHIQGVEKVLKSCVIVIFNLVILRNRINLSRLWEIRGYVNVEKF